jgi:quinol monooxygenase YgiN
MAFIQIVEFRSSQRAEVERLSHQYDEDTKDTRTVEVAKLCFDRDDPNHYMVIAEFPSYEAAMENSNLPETEALAEEMGKLADGPATYYNLEILHEFD